MEQGTLFNITETSIKQHAAQQLCRIADAMETTEPGSRERKSLGREYKAYAKQLGIGKTKQDNPPDQRAEIAKSRAYALSKIEGYLSRIRHWEIELPKLPVGETEHIAVSYLAFYSGMLCEINLEIPSLAYKMFSNTACYKAVKNLVFAKQLKSYASIEYGLLKMGMELCRGPYRKIFFNKYAVQYNQSIKQKLQQSGKQSN